MIARLLEHGHQRLELTSDRRMLSLASRLETNGRQAELWPEAHERLVAASGVENRLLEKRLCLGEPPRFLQGLTELQLELDPGVVGRWEQRRRTAEQVDRADHVAPIECTERRPPRASQRRARPARRRAGPALR